MTPEPRWRDMPMGDRLALAILAVVLLIALVAG